MSTPWSSNLVDNLDNTLLTTIIAHAERHHGHQLCTPTLIVGNDTKQFQKVQNLRTVMKERSNRYNVIQGVSEHVVHTAYTAGMHLMAAKLF